jgi:sterol desaturase/sphingolipid hydroxylase (fatty acid hydroxylase superfamily)
MSDTLLRLAVFLSVFGVMAILERVYALLPPPAHRLRMQIINVTLGALGAASIRLILPFIGTVVAMRVGSTGAGLLPTFGLSSVVSVAIGIVVLDFAVYWQHRWMHALPALWRLHRSHHLEEHLDASSAVRFHPVEIAASAVYRALIIAVLGLPVLAVLIFEIVINAAALFHHSNLRVPTRLDALLRLVVVTPAVHRVHHSVVDPEQRSNFGFSVTWWDQLFGSYRSRSVQAADIPDVGVKRTQPAPVSLGQILLDPIN